MKKYIIPLLTLFVLSSCNSKEEHHPNDLSEEQINQLEASSLNTIEEINYKGKFEGVIGNKKVVLSIENESFILNEGGKEFKGKWAKIDDGNTVELSPDKGSIGVKFYGISDNDTWVALTDSLTYIEPEQLLKRISK